MKRGMLPDYPVLTLRTRAAWRRWLQRHHASSRGVWLVHFKLASGERSVNYDDCVEEALCWGWIDSTIRKLDEIRYAHLLTPRNNPANWSELNKRRVAKMIAAGLMTPAGLAVYRPDLAPAGTVRADLPVAMPEFFERALNQRQHAAARRHFDALARSYRRQYIDWLAAARRDDTRARRLAEALRLLAEGKKLGMK
jgi:uncharacterized protein YdeI (YjbR/CyaY-like superfamily)